MLYYFKKIYLKKNSENIFNESLYICKEIIYGVFYRNLFKRKK